METASSPLGSFEKKNNQYAHITTLMNTCHGVALPIFSLWSVSSSSIYHLLHPTPNPSVTLNFSLIHKLALLLPTLFFPLKKSLPESPSPTLAFLANFCSRSASKSRFMTFLRQSKSFLYPQHSLHPSVVTFMYSSVLLIICLYVCLHLSCWHLQTRGCLSCVCPKCSV